MKILNIFQRRKFLKKTILFLGFISQNISASTETKINKKEINLLVEKNLNKAWLVKTVKLEKPKKIAHENVKIFNDSVKRAIHWTEHWLHLVVKYQQNPLRAARAIAHTQVAMHDAYFHAIQIKSPNTLAELAAHRAASLVLQHFYPNETAGSIEAQYAWIRAQISISIENEAIANSLGQQISAAVIARSMQDGAGQTWPIHSRPKNFSGIWKASYPLYSVNPTEAYAGNWQPWIKPSPKRYEPPPAARPKSNRHNIETQQVWEVSKHLSAAQSQAALDWNLDSGSVTPAGVWMQHTVKNLISKSKPNESQFATCTATLAAVSVAMQDALIACWRIKFRDWSERPITAIRRDLDKSFVPIVITPSFPGYVSGHATLSAAVAEVLGALWPLQADLFNAMAQEAAMSRLWGGIHFESDNLEGLKLGKSVGQEIIASLKQLKT
jgi:hypothetical protein